MSNPTLGTASDSGLSPVSPWSCFNCRRRKVRCDRHRPCLHCNKGGLECSFPVSGRLPTRQHDPAFVSSSKKKEAELRGRLRRLESIVEGLGAGFEEASAQYSDTALAMKESSQTDGIPRTGGTKSGEHKDAAMDDRHDTQSEQLAEEFGRLIVGKDGTFYFRSRLWAVLFDEVREQLLFSACSST